MTEDQERALGYWRKQLVLAVTTVVVGTVSLRLMALSIARESQVTKTVLADGRVIRDTSYLATLWPAAIGVVAVLGVTVVLAVHVVRVAAFTFRRGLG